VKLEVSREIGSGGFGSVFECRTETGRRLALKRLLPDSTDNDKERFRREVRLQTMLNSPGIVPVIHDLLDEEPPAFTMPLAAGSLEDYVIERGPGAALTVAVRQAAEALVVAHASNVLHRDLSPRNVLRFPTEEEELRFAVADFGLGIELDSESARLTRTHEGLGTIAYVAPEQLGDLRAATKQSDVFSLGRLLYYCLTGDVPFPVMDIEALPVGYRYLVRKACAVESRHRQETAAEFIRDLDRIEAREDEAGDPVLSFEALLSQVDAEDSASLGRALDVLTRNISNRAFLLRGLPLMSAAHIEALWRADQIALTSAVLAYDRVVAGELGFTYCDTVADFYTRLYWAVSESTIHRLVLHRLPRVGFAHNRWYVRSVFTRLLKRVDDYELLVTVAADFAQDTAMAEWHADAMQVLEDARVM
jgi:serine/threonine protein kinase